MTIKEVPVFGPSGVIYQARCDKCGWRYEAAARGMLDGMVQWHYVTEHGVPLPTKKLTITNTNAGISEKFHYYKD